MISIATKHIETAGKILPMRVTGTSGSTLKIKPVRFSYPLRYSYTKHPENGGSNAIVDTVFPGKYNDLATDPTWTGHRFLGWYTQANTPSTANVTSGSHLTSSSDIICDVTDVYANWQVAANVTFDATTNGGSMPSGWSAPEYYIGLTFDTLPIPTKSGQVFIGWYDGSGNKVVETTTITSNNLSLTARYVAVVAGTTYTCTTTSSYRNTGIYSATRQSTAEPIYIDWGDGTGEAINGNISQLVHTYSSNGTFTVKISDNINTFCPSSSNSTWYTTTSQNRYTFMMVTLLSGKISQLTDYSFYYCSRLVSWTIPDSITSIGANAFAFCTLLTEITLPSTLTSIGTYAFRSCSQLTSMIIPDSVTTIGDDAFYSCNGLTSVTIGNGVTSIGIGAFYSCSGLTSVTIPYGVTKIEANTFYHCAGLQSVTIPNSVTSIGNSAFNQCTSLTSLVIPDSVTSIGSSTFGTCSSLTSVTIPASVTSIGNYAFTVCKNLVTIICNAMTAPTVQSNSFGNSTANYTGYNSYSSGTNKLKVPAGATGYNTGYWLDPLCNSSKCGFTLEEI